MIVTFPSSHSGGQVLFKHREFSKKYDSSKSSQSFAFWYHNVEQTVKPIQSGQKLVLKYVLSIGWEASPVPKLRVHDETRVSNALRSLRRHLLESPHSPEVAIYLTTEKYSQDGTEDGSREEAAIAREELLRRLGGAEGFEMMFGRVERAQSGTHAPHGASPRHPSDFLTFDGETTNPSRMHTITRIHQDSIALAQPRIMQGHAVDAAFPVTLDECVQELALGEMFGSYPDAEEFSLFACNAVACGCDQVNFTIRSQT